MAVDLLVDHDAQETHLGGAAVVKLLSADLGYKIVRGIVSKGRRVWRVIVCG